MIDESIRLKRKLMEISVQADRFNLLAEKYQLQKNLNEIEQLGRVVDQEARVMDITQFKTAILMIKDFISKIEVSEEYSEELKKDEE